MVFYLSTQRPVKTWTAALTMILMMTLASCSQINKKSDKESDSPIESSPTTSQPPAKPSTSKAVSKPSFNLESAPSWVRNPKIKDGLAASACVKAKKELAKTKQHATNLAKSNLLANIVQRLELVEEHLASKSKNNPVAELSSGKESLIEAQIQSARAVKVNYVEIEKVRHLCVMLALSKVQSKITLESVLRSSNAAVGSDQLSELLALFLE